MNWKSLKFLTKRRIEAFVFLVLFFGIFGLLGSKMGTPNMLNTIMKTSYSLLIDTVLYIMGITVLSGALGKLLIEFGVVRLLEVILKPLMKPLFNLPGVAALGGIITFLSDNPAIISLAKDTNFNKYFKKYQLISLTNFGTAFGMGLVVIVFMAGRGYIIPALIGLAGAVIGSIISTRIMQRLILKSEPSFKEENTDKGDEQKISFKSEGNVFLRILNSVLDGGKTGVDLGLAIIPGVLIISTFVMILTFGPSENGYTGEAYEGIALLPYLAGKINFVFEWLFGFTNPELIAFPITSLGAVGAALGLVPKFQAAGLIDGNAIAVFTAMGMCWSGYLSTHTAMLDSLGFRKLTSKAIISHTIGGLAAGISAHWIYVLFTLIF
ncbi:MAG: nucleoside recognition domain-containing protein [Bacteroidales bacterium]